MSQHTPGPWRIARDTYGVERIWGPMEESIACAEGDGFIDDNERKANARLIAAAPVLLAACKECLGSLTPNNAQRAVLSKHPRILERYDTLSAMLRAAIAQAEGRE